MICNSCYNAIKPEEETVECDTCGKSIHSTCSIKEKDKTYCDRCYTTKDADEKTQIDIPDILRRSYIQTYKDCPYKFYKQVIDGIEGEMPIHAQVGIDLHDLFEKVSEGNISNHTHFLDLYKPMFDAYPDKMFERALHMYNNMGVQALKDNLWEKSINSAYRVFEVMKVLPKTPFALEEKITLDVGSDLPKVSITMDRIDEVDGELEITDWKTGALMVGQKLSNDIQVPLYIRAIQDHYGIPVRKFTLQYLSEGKERVFYRVNGDDYECAVGKRKYKINITDVVREVQHIFSQIINGNFNIPQDTKSMYFTCKTCHVKELGHCQGADVQSWRNIQ